jgi:hypothetical protein
MICVKFFVTNEVIYVRNRQVKRVIVVTCQFIENLLVSHLTINLLINMRSKILDDLHIISGLILSWFLKHVVLKIGISLGLWELF